ncbi:MAG: pro-sigmaK processing inhibitor BofA family protein [Bacillus sp. (in: firmicutes)]
MEPIVVVSIIVGLILILLFLGTSFKPLRFIGGVMVKFVIGAMFLFFLNAFGSNIDLHVPINVATAGVAGFLGIPGLLSLAAIQYWIL